MSEDLERLAAQAWASVEQAEAAAVTRVQELDTECIEKIDERWNASLDATVAAGLMTETDRRDLYSFAVTALKRAHTQLGVILQERSET